MDRMDGSGNELIRRREGGKLSYERGKFRERQTDRQEKKGQII